MVIDEYDLTTCEFIRTIADGSDSPTSIASAMNIDKALNDYVTEHWVGDSGPAPFGYFVWAFTPGGVPHAYEVTLFVQNECGTYSTSGWFNNSLQCLTDGGDDTEFLVAPPHNASQLLEAEAFEVMSIAPNPASSSIFVEMNSPSEEESEITVLDISGRSVLTASTLLAQGNNKVLVDVSTLPSGIYMLTVEGGAKIGQATFVKE